MKWRGWGSRTPESERAVVFDKPGEAVVMFLQRRETEVIGEIEGDKNHQPGGEEHDGQHPLPCEPWGAVPPRRLFGWVWAVSHRGPAGHR